ARTPARSAYSSAADFCSRRWSKRVLSEKSWAVTGSRSSQRRCCGTVSMSRNRICSRWAARRVLMAQWAGCPPKIARSGDLLADVAGNRTGRRKARRSLLGERGLQVLAVQPCDVLQADVLGALHLAGADVAAVAEALLVHLLHHGQRTPLGLGAALGQQGQLAHLGGHKEHGAAVGAGGHAGAAADAGGGVEGLVGGVLRNGDRVAVHQVAAGVHAHEAASGLDAVEGAA